MQYVSEVIPSWTLAMDLRELWDGDAHGRLRPVLPVIGDRAAVRAFDVELGQGAGHTVCIIAVVSASAHIAWSESIMVYVPKPVARMRTSTSTSPFFVFKPVGVTSSIGFSLTSIMSM